MIKKGLIPTAYELINKKSFSVVIFPLPYFRAAFTVAKGIQIIGRDDLGSPFDYMDLMFKHQTDIKSYANDVSQSELEDFITNLVSESMSIDR